MKIDLDKVEPHGRDYAFLKALFKDPDFVHAVGQLKDYFRERYGTDRLSKSHLRALVTEDDLAKLDKLAAKLHVQVWVIEEFCDGIYADSGLIRPTLMQVKTLANGNINITIGPHTTLKQLRALFPVIKSEQLAARKAQRDTPARNPALVYVIHKALRENPDLKIGDVFRLYQDQQLKGYARKPTIDDPKKFADLYRQHISKIAAVVNPH